MKTFILHITNEDTPYLPLVKSIFSGRAQVFIDKTVPISALELIIAAKEKKASGVISSSEKLLRLITGDSAKLSEYAGSILSFKNLEFLFIDPLQQLVTVSYGKFVLERLCSKFLSPEKWIPEPVFAWELFTPSRVEEYVQFFQNCDLLAVDIETFIDDPERAIECISYTGVILHGMEFAFRTLVVPCDSLFSIYFIRTINSLKVGKVLQNGKYDIAYLLRFGAPLTNYCLDTLNLFHCWLSELPKDLGFISAMMVRGYAFHKREGSGDGKYARYSYNAKDTYYTALSALALLLELPRYAEQNFLQQFPLVFPCSLCENTGIKWDTVAAGRNKARVEASLEQELVRLRTMVSNDNFNPGSWQQTLKLFVALGSKDVTSTDVKGRDKVAFRHPLNEVILGRIDKYRKGVKENGSYYKESIPWLGRCFYTLNPTGTDTGRLSSRESQFWCGLQIQNIKRDSDSSSDDEETYSVKDAFISDTDFYFGEADSSQAETRGTAYITGDLTLIRAVEDTTKDFHGWNAHCFFGVSYEEIVRSTQDQKTGKWKHKILNKPLRDLSKRTNHGANYNMGAKVMLDTMGVKKVLRAKELLGLPARFSLLQVTQYLLDVFAKTYPIVRNNYQEWIKTNVEHTGYLVGATGWTRKCFGHPRKNKLDLNSYVAHCPQSLNAMLLNRAFLNVFQRCWLKEENRKDFKLCAQIHDSILFQYRKDREDLPFLVAECMNIPIVVKDILGVERTMIVPVDLKGRGTRWSELSSLSPS